jgi:hypothetical protein
MPSCFPPPPPCLCSNCATFNGSLKKAFFSSILYLCHENRYESDCNLLHTIRPWQTPARPNIPLKFAGRWPSVMDFVNILVVLTSWNWALLEKPPVTQLLKNFSIFYKTRRFITVFTRALLSWARSIESIPPHPISLRSILVLFTHLPFGIPSGHFPFRFVTNILFSPFVLRALPISSSLVFSF